MSNLYDAKKSDSRCFYAESNSEEKELMEEY